MNETREVPARAMRCSVAPLELGDNGEGAKSAPFRMVARTGDALDHWYFGRVVHDLSGMQLHKDRLPIDYAHDEGELIGYANKFDIDTGDLLVAGALVPYGDNDRAAEIKHKHDLGVPYEASINFAGPMSIEEVDAGQTVEVNGREFSGPINVIREWSLRGIAVCPYGYDMNTETSLSAGQTLEIEVMAKEELTADVAEVEAATATVEATDATDNAEATEAVDAPQEEATEATVEADAEPAELSAGEKYLEAFGDQGGVWFAQGKTFEEATALHIKRLESKVEELSSKLSSVGQGEAEPVEFTAEQPPKKSFADRFKLPGQS